MITWDQIDQDSEADWTKLTNQLITEAQAAVQSLNDAQMQSSSNDIIDYFQHGSFHKPEWASKALVRTQAQVTAARQVLGLDNLAQRTDKMDAILARISSAGNELKAEAAKLRLQPIKDALQMALETASELKSVVSDVKSIPKDDIASRLARVLKSLDKLGGKLGEALA